MGGGLEIALLCLALNVFYEARGESYDGQLAVAQVTIRRARVKGREICDEVYSPYQFSWTLKKVEPPLPTDAAWIQSQIVALDAFRTKDRSGGALWYHHKGISPWWVWNKIVVKQIGDHVFYKCKPKYQCDWR